MRNPLKEQPDSFNPYILLIRINAGQACKIRDFSPQMVKADNGKILRNLHMVLFKHMHDGIRDFIPKGCNRSVVEGEQEITEAFLTECAFDLFSGDDTGIPVGDSVLTGCMQKSFKTVML